MTLRIVAPNLADDLTALTSTPEASATLPVGNLLDPTRARVWRSTTNNDQTIYGDWDSAQTISCLILARTNFTAAALVRLKLYDDAGQMGTELYDSGAVGCSGDLAKWGWRDIWLWFAPISGARSFSLLVDDNSNPAGYVQAGRLVFGAYFEPAMTISYGSSLEWAEQSTQERTEGGSLRTDSKLPYRVWRFRLDWLTEADRGALLQLAYRVGMREDIYISLFPGGGDAKEQDYAAMVKVTQWPKLIHTMTSTFATDLVAEEA